MTPSKDKATQEAVERLESLTASMESEDCDGIVIPGHGPLHTAALRLLLDAHKARNADPVTMTKSWAENFLEIGDGIFHIIEEDKTPGEPRFSIWESMSLSTFAAALEELRAALPSPQDQGGDE